jgi:lysophospholipase L1-like esterase
MVKRAAQGSINVAFFGDSLTQAWGKGPESQFAKYFGDSNAVNFGIGGDSTRQVLWRLENGQADGYEARLFVVMVGTNNLYSDFNSGTDEEIAEGVKRIVETLRKKQPSAKVLLLGILPRENDYFCGRADRVNSIVASLDNGASVRFLNLRDQFLAAPGKVKPELYTKDELHLSSAGYDALYAGLRPLFEQMLK